MPATSIHGDVGELSPAPATAAAPCPSMSRPPLATGPLAVIAAVKLAAQLVAVLVSPYGFHRDEFLYLAMGKYLRFWSMDFPPAIAVIANVTRGLFGDSLLAIRLPSAIAGTAVVILAALVARELGGGRRAQVLSAVTVLVGPLFLRSAALFQPVVFDQLWWLLALLALAKLGRRNEPRWWLLLGVAGGFGLLTKFSIGVIGVAAVVAIALTPLRRAFATRWPWVAAAIALAIGSPSIVGQIQLGFPVLGQMEDLQSVQLQRVGAGEFLGGQLLSHGAGALLALAGALYLLRARAMKPFRAVGWTCVIAFAMLLAAKGKPYYAGPLFPALFAAGWVAVERLRHARLVSAALIVAVITYAAPALPMGLPIVAPEPMARYAAWLGVTSSTTTNTGEVLALPQDYADMLAWEEQVAAVSRAWRSLPPADQARAVVIASNYGEAGAVDFLGPRHGLPRAVAPVGSYWFFGPGDRPGEVAVVIGAPPEDLAQFYGDVRVVERVPNPWGVPEQRDNPIVIARQPRATLQAIWPRFEGEN